MNFRRLLGRSLHGRLIGLLLTLLLGLGAVSLLAILRGSRLFSEEVHFQLDEEVASHISKTIQPSADGDIAEEELKSLFAKVMVINPSLEVYLIDLQGGLLAYDAPEEHIQRRRVDLRPVRQFLAAREGRTIRGDDPRRLEGEKPISVHPMEVDGRPMGYLYIVLGGERYDSIFATLRQSYIVRYAALLVAGTLVVASVVGIFALGMLTRPLRRLRRSMTAFHSELGGEEESVSLCDDVEALELSFGAMRRRIDEQLRELHATDERRREFVASVSHDLRTPASAVQGYIEALIDRRDRLTEAQRDRYLEIALRQTRRLGDLVGRLFELARLEAREAEPQKESFSLGELVQDIVCDSQAAADRKGVVLRARFPYDLPPVRADIGLIERAVENLLDNAMRYTPPGSEVVIGLEQVSEGVEVRVTDAGPGIPAEELPRLFDRFYRIRRAEREAGQGTGLGLAITQRIIDMHDSSIHVESRLEQGTTFSFVLRSDPGTS